MRKFIINTKMIYCYECNSLKANEFFVKVIQKYASLVYLNKWHFLVETMYIENLK